MDDDQKIDDGSRLTDESPDVAQEDVVVSQTPQDDQSATILESMTSLILENLAKIARLNDELSKQKEMLESVLENDEVYKAHSEAAKQAQKVKTATKSEIVKRPEVAHVFAKVKELSAEIKEAKDSLNSYLPEYQRLSGSNEIEDTNGEPLQIIYSAKLIKRRP